MNTLKPSLFDNIIKNKIEKQIKYYDEFFGENSHTSSNKTAHYILFDKNHEPFILEFKDNCINYSLTNKKIEWFDARLNTVVKRPGTTNKFYNHNFGLFKFTVNDHEISVDYLLIDDKNYLRRGIGSKLIEFMSYFGYVSTGKDNMNLVALPLKEKFINKENLVKFYNTNGFKGFDETSEYMESEINPAKQKEYANRIFTIKNNHNVIYKVVLPKEANKQFFMEWKNKFENEQYKQKHSTIDDVLVIKKTLK